MIIEQKIYYKAARPNLASFHDEKFFWPVKGVVEVPDAAVNGACGPGLHLGETPENAISYAKFPFRLLEVRPLSPILGQDDTKIRVAKAEVVREIPIPEWAKRVVKGIERIQEEVKTVPWFKGTDAKKAKSLIRSHLKLLTPFGLKIEWEIEVITDKKEAASAWDAAWDAASDAARDAAWNAARNAASDAASDVASDATSDAQYESVADLLPHKNPFKPLCECWKIGAWPIGFVGKKFMVYVAKVKS